MKDARIELRLTANEKQAWLDRAKKVGLSSIAAYLRRLVNADLSSPEQCTSEPPQPSIATPTVALVDPAPRKTAIAPPMYAAPAPPIARKPCPKCQRVLFNGATCQYCLTSPVA